MCGIFGYIGNGKANTSDVLLDGLRSLEYRGYDSAGIYIAGAGEAVKAVGPVNNLARKTTENLKILKGSSGIAHTRWATHGKPSEANAHPHSGNGGRIWIAHNGIIENYKELKKIFLSKGHIFKSETDSEVLAHLIEDKLNQDVDLKGALALALKEVKGTYGLIAIDKEGGSIIAARMGSPLLVGIGEEENFISSDAAPILRHTKNVIYLNDGEMAVVSADNVEITTLDNNPINRKPDFIDWNVEEACKSGYDHFMLKEIMEAPEVICNTLRGRIVMEEGVSKLGGLESVSDKLRDIERIIIVGCGTAYYAGLVGEYMIEEYAGIPVEVEVGSEFRYRKPIINKNTAVLAVSQSGETADTLEAIREAKRKGALTLGIVNIIGSTIARETSAGVYNHAGPEIGVASTKAFISQITALALFTLLLGRQRSMSLVVGQRIAKELLDLPKKAEVILSKKEEIKRIAEKYAGYKNFLFIGRKYNNPIAYEGALKLKEVSYAHAEGYGAGEMKHGPLAMIDENFPTVAIAPQNSVYEKMLSNIEEIKARNGLVIAVASEGDEKIKEIADDVIFVPKTIEMLSPALSTIPLQLFAYYFAIARGLNVDKPRNLAKSVTVE